MGKKTDKADAVPLVDTRGQISVTLGGADYILRPSFEAIQAIEREIRPLYELTQLAAASSMRIEEMATVIVHFMRAHGKACPEDPQIADYKAAKPERIAKLIFEAGAPKVMARILVLCLGALSGGYDAEGEPKAPPPK